MENVQEEEKERSVSEKGKTLATMFRRRQREKEPKKKWQNGEIEMQKAKKTNV